MILAWLRKLYAKSREEEVWKTLLRSLVYVVIYFVVGILFYTLEEEKSCSEDGSGEECTEAWGTIDALYFSVVTMSTVGYGDFSPSKPETQAFTILYIVVGVVVVFSSITKAMDILMKPIFMPMHIFFSWLFPETLIDIDGNGKADAKVPRRVTHFYILRLLPHLVVNMGVQLIAAEAFHAVEGWDYGTACYHCLVTATTVGYGDVSINTRDGRIVAICHILISVCLLGDTITEYDTARAERKEELLRYNLLRKKLDKDLILSLDKDGSGVDKTEYVIGMLINLGLVEEEDVIPFVKQFSQLDKSGDGRLTREDLEEVAKGYHERAATLPVGSPSSKQTTVDGAPFHNLAHVVPEPAQEIS